MTTVNNSQNIAIAKAIVFVDTPTQARWMLLKDTTTAAPLSTTSSNATTLCSGAKVTTINNNSYNSQTGVWALPSSKQVAWMLKTGATAPDGLIGKENLFSVSSKFWVYDPPATIGTIGTYKTAYFTDILSDPVIESAGTYDTANVVCVFKPATAGGGSGGNAPPNPTNLAATTPAANSVALAWVSGGGTTVGYRVSYLAGQTAPSTCSTGTQVSSGSISGTNASITGLSASTIYSFRVCAIDGSSTPLVSSGITVTVTTSGSGSSGTGTGSGTGSGGNLPPDPQDLRLSTAVAGQITLSWVSGNGSTAGFKIAYQSGQTPPTNCNSGTSGITVVDVNLPTTNTLLIPSLLEGNTYAFRLCAVDSSGNKSAGITATATTTSGGGTSVGGTSGTGGGMVFTWKTNPYPVMFETTLPDNTVN
ncbi:MAG: fibronectin type III domain-containing protein, partial [Proteobacteria bacterium]|nr:fibronectin type III domain-containing protein [Pseudomonadota bacterium]